MDVQSIITIIIVTIAAIIAVRHFWHALRPSRHKESNIICSGGCGGCNLKKMCNDKKQQSCTGKKTEAACAN